MIANLEAERAYLGAAMQDARAAQQLAACPENAFTDPAHQAVHRAIKRLVDAGKVPDIVSVDAEAKCDLDDTALIADLAMRGFAPSAAGQYEGILLDCRLRRQLLALGERLLSTAADPSADPQALAAEAAQAAQGDGQPTSAAIGQAMRQMAAGLGQRRGISTGIAGYDALTGGLQKGQLIYIGARPGVGKSALMTAMAMHIASHTGPVLACSLEMTAEELAMRVAAHAGKIDLEHLAADRMTPEDTCKVTQLLPLADRLPLRIATACRTVRDVRREAGRMQAREGLCTIFVDYAQLLQTDRSESLYADITRISRDLKLLAMDLNLPVVALSQFNRQSEQRDRSGRPIQAEPSMAEARGSGAIEQDANVFVVLHAPAEPSEGEALVMWALCKRQNCDWLRMHVTKNRNGRTGYIDLMYDKPHVTFTTIDRRSLAQDAQRGLTSVQEKLPF